MKHIGRHRSRVVERTMVAAVVGLLVLLFMPIVLSALRKDQNVEAIGNLQVLLTSLEMYRKPGADLSVQWDTVLSSSSDAKRGRSVLLRE